MCVCVVILNIITSWDTRRLHQQVIFCEIPPVIQLSLHFFLIKSRFDYCEILSLESCSSLHTKVWGRIPLQLFYWSSYFPSILFLHILSFFFNVASFLLGSVIRRSVCMWIIWNPKNASRRFRSTNTFYFSLRYLVYCRALIVFSPPLKETFGHQTSWQLFVVTVVLINSSMFSKCEQAHSSMKHIQRTKNIVCLKAHSCKSEKWMQECLNQWKVKSKEGRYGMFSVFYFWHGWQGVNESVSILGGRHFNLRQCDKTHLN